jgi:uncharacterized protein (DUF305 family)
VQRRSGGEIVRWPHCAGAWFTELEIRHELRRLAKAIHCPARPVWDDQHVRASLPTAATLVMAAVTSAVTTAAAQSPRLVQPGAPGQPTREISSAEATDTTGVRHGAADIRFMQGMIGHHAQALEMVELVATRSRSDGLKQLARRIDVSQRDEMQMMREWLTRRGESLPDPHAHHTAHGRMPGMLTAEQMATLAAASGPEFDRLFLTGMIQHHEGALTMVKELFASPGAGQEPEMFDFASDVEADQAMEIARMRAMLKEIGK